MTEERETPLSANHILTVGGIVPLLNILDSNVDTCYQHTTYKNVRFVLSQLRHERSKAITTEDGYQYIIPNTYYVETSFDGIVTRRKVSNICSGDRLLLNHYQYTWGSIDITDNVNGYLLGFLVGDGTIYQKDDKLYARMYFFKDDIPVKEYVKDICSQMSISLDRWANCYRYRGQCKRLHTLINKYHIGKSKDLGFLFADARSALLKSFLSGLFDADGHVTKKELSIILVHSNKNNIHLIQYLLSFFGIHSKIHSTPPRNEIICKKIRYGNTTYYLTIRGDNAVSFNKLIGFRHPDKHQMLQDKITKRKHLYLNNTATVTEIRDSSISYQTNSPYYVVNGLVVRSK